MMSRITFKCSLAVVPVVLSVFTLDVHAAPAPKKSRVAAKPAATTMESPSAASTLTPQRQQPAVYGGLGVNGVGEQHPAFVGAARYGMLKGTRMAPLFSYSDRDGSFDIKNKDASGGNNAVPVISGMDLDYAIASQGMSIVAMHALPGSPVRAGLKIARRNDVYKIKFKTSRASEKSTFRESGNELTPVLGAALSDNWMIGAEYTTGSEVETPQDGVESTLNYAYFSPSVLYVGEAFEAGLRYDPTVSIEDADSSFARPGSITVHGRMNDPASKLAWFAVAKHVRTRALNSDLKNSAEFTVGADMPQPGRIYSAYGIWNTASYKDADGFSPFSTGRYGIGLGGNWKVASNGQIGADVKITSSEGAASDDSTSEKVNEQMVTGTLAGSLAF